ncbi:sensor histidine kinase [Actinomadura rupiterrae]|uniref:sensor histidine kinase n=1 Tax=Actinomadura rupiterrae TaxID=559627 RepID=UPI0020A2F16F|nr:HAMP domain-containing sensor histidine kinase [Actinomadura rupiterrae]MCP2341874.1 signal transduction histidine kinase [Actinomadura rupiterrae]
MPGRWPPGRWTLRTRVTVAATVVVGVLLAAGAVGFYAVLRHAVYGSLRDRGEQAVTALAQTVGSTDPHGPAVLRPSDTGFPLLQVQDDKGRVLAASPEIAGRPAIVTLHPDAGHPTLTRKVTVAHEEVYVVAMRVHARDGWRVVYAGAPMPGYLHSRAYFTVLLVLAVPLGLLLVAVSVSLAVRRALRPVRRMSAELAEVTGSGPGRMRRVTVPASHDEIAQLASSVNVTLHRLERTVMRQRQFVGDVSHELRSPLTGLRAQLEVALEHPEDEDWPEVARCALNDADRLQRIVTDLLLLAKLDAGVPLGREPVDLGDLAQQEGGRVRRVPVDISVEQGVVVLGARGALLRLITNLLDNAARHARSRVLITVVTSGSEAVLTVEDDGEGIPRADRDRVFQRFQRLAEGRKRDTGGSGLGLPISRDIAQAHGGTLVIADTKIGARLVLTLPKAP